MIKKTVAFFLLVLIVFCTITKAQLPDRQLKKLSDAPDDSILHPVDTLKLLSYTTALKQWKTVAEVNKWIKENFRYEIERAKQLAENSLEREKTEIYSPVEFYQIKKGVCLDLSRFAVETTNSIDTSKHVQYLMIEFEPIIIDHSLLKKHWVAIFQEAAGFYIFADSKRPGHISGPYKNVDDFIVDYQTFRARKIVDWKVLPSYQKKKKMMQQKMTRPFRISCHSPNNQPLRSTIGSHYKQRSSLKMLQKLIEGNRRIG